MMKTTVAEVEKILAEASIELASSATLKTLSWKELSYQPSTRKYVLSWAYNRQKPITQTFDYVHTAVDRYNDLDLPNLK